MSVPRYSTIQVTPQTRRRLARYKMAKMSYEDVLKLLLNAIPAEELRARVDVAGRAAAARLAPLGRREPHLAAEEAREREDARIARLTPAERMEETFRLSQLMRGTP